MPESSTRDSLCQCITATFWPTNTDVDLPPTHTHIHTHRWHWVTPTGCFFRAWWAGAQCPRQRLETCTSRQHRAVMVSCSVC